MQRFLKRAETTISAFFIVGLIGLTTYIVLARNLRVFVMILLLIFAIAAFYLPNRILLKKGNYFGLIGSTVTLVFLVGIIIEFFVMTKSMTVLRLGAILCDVVIFSGLLGYALLLLRKNKMLAFYSAFAVAALMLFGTFDASVVLNNNLNITVWVVERGIPGILYWRS